jgi:hypothetical protein
MVATAAAAGIKPRIVIYKSQNLTLSHKNTTRVGHPKTGSCDFGRGSFLLGRICLGEQEMLSAFSQRARSSISGLRRSM